MASAGTGPSFAKADTITSIFLDPTYTGKAMAAYRTLLSHGRYSRADVVLFLHTGGAPGLFTAAAERMP
jgi:D-cysteine desulfhydrase